MHTFKANRSSSRKLIKFIADQRTPLSHDYAKWERKNWWLRRAGLNIGHSGVAIDYGFRCLTGLEENLHIGEFCAIGINCHIWNFNEVRIGRYCMFAADVTLTNGGHDPDTFVPFSGPLSVGNGCWIGNGARIVGSVTIGNNAIVGAGAVVVRDVPAGSIVTGVPARVIGERTLPKKVWHLGNTFFDPNTFEEVSEED